MNKLKESKKNLSDFIDKFGYEKVIESIIERHREDQIAIWQKKMKGDEVKVIDRKEVLEEALERIKFINR